MKDINPEIKQYIEQDIIPAYMEFDKAHNINHAYKVISNSLSIASEYNVNINMVYVIAAYHDIGLKNGRNNHEKSSALFLTSDLRLKEWFSDDDIILMADAVEDHRASNDYEPRSIYGKIVAEADRDIEYTSILTRTIQYGLKNYPDYNFEQHFNRTYEHMQKKYGESGYLKLWLNTDINKQNLEKLRFSLKLKDKVKDDFNKVYYSIIEDKS